MLYVGPANFYTVPAFTTVPTGSESSIVYSDVTGTLPNSVMFSSETQYYSWSNSIPVGSYTFTMQGTLAGSSPATV